jgi:hypothetical protein
MKSEKIPDDALSTPATKDDVREEVVLMVAMLEACELSRMEARDAENHLLDSSTNADSIFEPCGESLTLDPLCGSVVAVHYGHQLHVACSFKHAGLN